MEKLKMETKSITQENIEKSVRSCLCQQTIFHRDAINQNQATVIHGS